jgi:hypothetical protein
MTSRRSDKSSYPSRYSPEGWVSPYQYITELICEKKAQQGSKELPIKFWEIKEWRSFYRYQITLATALVKEYGEEAVIAALKDRRCYKTYSLRAPFLKPIIEEHKKTQEKAKRVDAEDLSYNFDGKENFSSNNQKRSLLSDLEDLEE